MKILILYTSVMRLGGVETLIPRMAKVLNRLGHEVTVLLTDDEAQRNAAEDSPLGQLRKDARVILSETRFPFALPKLRQVEWEDYDILFTFDSSTLILTFLVQQFFQPRAKVVVGCYHSKEFCSCVPRKRFMHKLSERAFRAMPRENILFMNHSFREEHARCMKENLSACPVIPLPVDTDRFADSPRRAKRGKFVSIGRLTNFKTYNWTMLDTLLELDQLGEHGEYHLYGEGEKQADIERMIVEKGLSDRVFLHGSLPYSQFSNVLEDAFCFVGMGTAAIEAAACGVPVLSGVDSVPGPHSYGFLHETADGNIGEIRDEPPTHRFSEELKRLFDAAPEEYAEVEAASRKIAQTYSANAVMTRIVDAMMLAGPFSFRISPSWSWLCKLDSMRWKVAVALGVPDPSTERYQTYVKASSEKPVVFL